MIRQPVLHSILQVSFSPVTPAWPETFVIGRNAPADRIQPGVIAQCKKPTAQMTHLVFSDTQANAQKTKRAIFCQRTDRKLDNYSNIFYLEKRDIEN